MRRVKAAALVALAYGAFFAAHAQAKGDDSKSLKGAWQGTLQAGPGREIRLILRVEPGEAGAYKVALDSPDEGLFDLALEPANAKGDQIDVGIKISGARVSGKLNAAGDVIDATFTQRQAKLPIKFNRADPAKVPKAVAYVVPAELEGLWMGALKLPGGIELRLVLNVSKKDDGTLKAVLDSPDQNANGLPITSLEYKDRVLKFESKPLRASYEGKLNADGTVFEGTFTQGQKFELNLKKTDVVAERPRPQHPKPPFPYDEELVAYENTEANIKLAGTLTLPRGEGPFPVVLLITGSGPQDRDETLVGHKPFLVLADYLTRRGIAVLRVDDRGVGGSTGSIVTSTSEDFAGDVLAGVAFLKTHPKIDGKKIGLCGHSEGGLIAPIVAARSDDVAFIVLMAGTGVPGTDILRVQSRLIAKAMGASDRAIEVSAGLNERSYAVLASEPDNKKALAAMKEIAKEMFSQLDEKDRKALDAQGGDEALSLQLEQAVTPWFRYFLTYDPRQTLAKVKCPVLAINGEKDLQVSPSQNLPEIEKAVRSGGNDRVTVVELKGLNHLFQTSKTGAPSEYGSIEETLAPIALETIGDWIVEQTR